MSTRLRSFLRTSADPLSSIVRRKSFSLSVTVAKGEIPTRDRSVSLVDCSQRRLFESAILPVTIEVEKSTKRSTVVAENVSSETYGKSGPQSQISQSVHDSNVSQHQDGSILREKTPSSKGPDSYLGNTVCDLDTTEKIPEKKAPPRPKKNSKAPQEVAVALLDTEKGVIDLSDAGHGESKVADNVDKKKAEEDRLRYDIAMTTIGISEKLSVPNHSCPDISSYYDERLMLGEEYTANNGFFLAVESGESGVYRTTVLANAKLLFACSYATAVVIGEKSPRKPNQVTKNLKSLAKAYDSPYTAASTDKGKQMIHKRLQDAIVECQNDKLKSSIMMVTSDFSHVMKAQEFANENEESLKKGNITLIVFFLPCKTKKKSHYDQCLLALEKGGASAAEIGIFKDEHKIQAFKTGGDWEAIARLKEEGCVKCGCNISVEVDHIFPVSDGGKSDKSNAQILCKGCHDKKTSMDKAIKKEKYNIHGDKKKDIIKSAGSKGRTPPKVSESRT